MGEALTIYEKIYQLRPEEPTSLRDLALILVQQEGRNIKMHYNRAIELLDTILNGVWPEIKFERYNQIEVVALMYVPVWLGAHV